MGIPRTVRVGAAGAGLVAGAGFVNLDCGLAVSVAAGFLTSARGALDGFRAAA
jgi:hypothetical protein